MPSTEPIPIPVPTLGLLKAVDREQIPPDGLAESENWIARDRDFRVRPGLTTFGNSVGQRPTGLIHYDHGDGTLRTVEATVAGWKTFNYSTRLWTSIGGTPLTGGIEQQVFRVVQQAASTFLIGTNWKDAPKKWDGLSGTYLDIGGSPPISRTMLILNSHVIMGNLRSGPNVSPVAVDWGNFNNFDAGWGAQATLLADTPGEIAIGEEMGNATGAFIKTDAAYRVIAQSGVVPFRFDYVPVPKDQGAASTLGYVRIGDNRIVYLALDGNLKSFDLNVVSDFGGDNCRVHLQETLDFSSIGRSWMAYDSASGEILVVYPQRGGSGEPDCGLIVKRNGAIYPLRWAGRKLTAGTFGRVSKLLTFADMQVPFGSVSKTFGELAQGDILRQILAADSAGQAYSFSGDTDNGTAIQFLLETGLNSIGAGTRLKTVNSLEHRTNRTLLSQPMAVQIGVSKSGEARTLSNPQTIDLADTATKITGHRVTSKYLSVRLQGAATQPVVWRGSFVSAAQRGSWR